MSGNTPTSGSKSPQEASSPNPPADLGEPASQTDRFVLEYLRKRGHAAAEEAFLKSLEGNTTTEKGKGKESEDVSADELVKLLVSPSTERSSETTTKDISASGLKSFLDNLGAQNADDLLSFEPSDRQRGYQELEGWVEGSLDMYRVLLVSC
jgi:transcription initiation factor TFIID subunit 5